jgi:hypothetical protein
MTAASRQIIARRQLLYSPVGGSERKQCAVCISAPYLLSGDSVPFAYDEGTAGCVIAFDGLAEQDIEVFGADGIQALALATDIDPYLRGLSRKYEFFYETGEPYFE